MSTFPEVHLNHWQSLPKDHLLSFFSVTEEGLSPEQVTSYRKRWGPNRLPDAPGPSALRQFLAQFNTPLQHALNLSGIVSLVLGRPLDATIIWAVLLISAVSGFLQERRSEKALAALHKILHVHAKVRRAGSITELLSEELVPGDIVMIEAGDKVPADIRLLEAHDLRIDESTLTGESFPSHKSLRDENNMAFMSTLVTHGRGVGVVVDIGENTHMGKIARSLAHVSPGSPLSRKVSRLTCGLLIMIATFSTITFLVGISRQQNWVDLFMAAIAMSVGAIPEGLPVVFTIIMALGVSRMAKNQAIIRKLSAVETLGELTVICVDKTGTLTENRLTVTDVVSEQPEETLRAGLLCNDARSVDEGDPTERALLEIAMLQHTMQRTLPRLAEIPFSSERGYMATLHTGGVVYVKGSPEIVLSLCANLEPEQKERWWEQVLQLTQQGKRVLAFAKAEDDTLTPETFTTNLPSLTFLGFQALRDTLRPAALSSVRACQTAGIAVKMISGDHALTAQAIAIELGIAHADQVMTGTELDACSISELRERLPHTGVFARVLPQQKLRIIEALQANGEIVAMTGDGVNDAPALKKADVGIAIMGTEVAKEAADMVIVNEDFSTIERAIEEGRCLFQNLQLFLHWTVPAHIGLGLIIFCAIMLNLSLPILPLQIIWVNTITALCIGMMLAFEPKSKDIMLRPPIPPTMPLLSRQLMKRIFWIGGALTLLSLLLHAYRGSHTLAMNGVVLAQIAYVFTCRTFVFRNYRLWLGIVVLLGLQVLMTYHPYMQWFFHTAPLTLLDWGLAGLGALVVYFVGVAQQHGGGIIGFKNNPHFSGYTQSKPNS